MGVAVKLTAIGHELGVILPEDCLHRLDVAVGDTLYLTETPTGMHLSACDPEELEAMERVMRKNRDVLKRLSES